MAEYKTIAELPNYIVLDNYTKLSSVQDMPVGYQSEAALEKEFIQDLTNQGYEYMPNINSAEGLMANLRIQLQTLNGVRWSDAEWKRLLEEYLDRPNDHITEKTEMIHHNDVYDFVFDDGRRQNIYLIDKSNILRNRLQVVNQVEQTGTHANRYDVTILLNGLPLVQVELKRRGVAIREAFNQVHRYSKESFNSNCSLFKFLQMFVISNGTDTRYFANTVKRDKNSFDFTMNWAKADNTLIKDLKDFTATFFQKNTLLQILTKYTVFDTSKTLLIMRPYQIAATERILWKIHCAHQAKQWGTTEGGGFVWHTTGSGKTLTSFKAARLATQLPFIDKVFFVVDRKDLDYQTIKEYQRFSPDSVNGSDSTAGLKRNIENNDNKIIVTTLQKLNNLMRGENNLAVYQQHVVLIFDECHRSQFGEAQKLLRKKFKRYYQFGFTGTPIFSENALGDETTQTVFGRQLHTYIITDAIRDEKVLKFKVDYNDVRPKFRHLEQEQDMLKLTAAENNRLLLHPERIEEISTYILKNYHLKTHRNMGSRQGFNAMLAVSSVEAAKYYYETLNRLQADAEHKLRIATIFSYAANEEQQAASGEIQEENFEPQAMDLSSKEFLCKVIDDYNRMFGCNFGTDGQAFQNYYRDLSLRVKRQEVDLIIVVGMFLTGFDAPKLNTLFVDKNMRYHGLIQAYSRTNRIYDATKTFGNIVCFRDLEQATIDALRVFGNKNTASFVLERSYREYIEGFEDLVSGHRHRGYKEVVQELLATFPEPDEIVGETNKKQFVKLFGEFLRLENILQNYDEFNTLKELAKIDPNDETALATFAQEHGITEETLAEMQTVELLTQRMEQDYRSTYNDIRDWIRVQRRGEEAEEMTVNWDDVIFEVDLLKSQEIDLDYILELIYEQNKTAKSKEALIEEVTRIIRASMGHRAKEGLIVDFIHQTNLDAIPDKSGIMEAFYTYAQARQRTEAAQLIAEENLNEEAAKRYLRQSLRQQYASVYGTDLNDILPRMSPLNPKFRAKKQQVLERIEAFVEKFKEIGGEL